MQIYLWDLTAKFACRQSSYSTTDYNKTATVSKHNRMVIDSWDQALRDTESDKSVDATVKTAKRYNIS